MKTLLNPIVIFLFGLGLFLYVAKQMKLNLPNWIHFYAADFICMPLVLSVILIALRYFYKNEAFQIPLFAIVSLTVYYALFFEWILPKVSERYTADWIDVLLYALGSSVFYLLQKKQII